MKLPDDGLDCGAVLLSADCRVLRRALSPLVWTVLEEVALDGASEDGRLVARTSARQVAEQLGINPGTAAQALRVLGRRGLVSLEREKGPAGRFGLSVYELRPPTGLTVVHPCVAGPLMVSASALLPAGAESAMASPCAGSPHVKPSAPVAPDAGSPDSQLPRTVEADMVPISTPAATNGRNATRESSARRSRRRTAQVEAPGQPVECPGQGTFDLGPVSL